MAYAFYEQDLHDAQEHCRLTREPCLVGWTDPDTGQRHYKWAVVPCACGQANCTAVVCVMGDPGAGEDHVWQLELHDDNTFSLSPSLQMRGGCNAHYFFKRGLVQPCP